jgi:inhibitor of cysteine peptidase
VSPLASLALAAAVLACGGCQQEKAMAQLTLGADDNGRTLQVQTGGSVVLRLPENPSTGYRWAWQATDGTQVEVESEAFQAAPGLAPGAAGERVFQLRPRVAGVAVLRLVLRRPWEAGSGVSRYQVTLKVVGAGAASAPR